MHWCVTACIISTVLGQLMETLAWNLKLRSIVYCVALRTKAQHACTCMPPNPRVFASPSDPHLQLPLAGASRRLQPMPCAGSLAAHSASKPACHKGPCLYFCCSMRLLARLALPDQRVTSSVISRFVSNQAVTYATRGPVCVCAAGRPC
jgi:hypothetical protein